VAGLAAASGIVAPTRAVLGDLQRRYGAALQRAKVINNGIDPAAFHPCRNAR
jgi:hypothetical protein